MKNSRFFSIIALAALMAFAFFACDGTIAPPDEPDLGLYTVTFDSMRAVWADWVEPISVDVKKIEDVELGTALIDLEDWEGFPALNAFYDFEGWFTDPEEGEEFTENTPVNANITVYARWTLPDPTYSVNFKNRYHRLAGTIWLSNYTAEPADVPRMSPADFTGTYSGYPFDIRFFGGNTNDATGAYEAGESGYWRTDGANRWLVTAANNNGTAVNLFVKPPMMIKVEMSSDSSENVGIGVFNVFRRTSVTAGNGDRLARAWTKVGTSDENRDIYTVIITERNTARADGGWVLSMEALREEMGMRSTLYWISIWEMGDE